MIRKARAADASRLAEILIFTKRSAYREIFHDDQVSFGEMQVLPLALEFQNTPAILEPIWVYDDGIVKGMANILTTHANSTSTTELRELYVDPFFQGEGIGRALMAHAMKEGKENKSTQFILWVLEKNHNAREFYQKQGFTYTGEKKLLEGTSEYQLKYSLAQPL